MINYSGVSNDQKGGILEESENKMKTLIKKMDDPSKLTSLQQALFNQENLSDIEDGNRRVKKRLKTFQEVKDTIKKMFTEKEKKNLRLKFLLNSSNGIMSSKNFFKLLSLDAVGNTAFGKIFFRTACNFNETTNPNTIILMDEIKFLQTMAIFTKPDEINKYANEFCSYSSDENNNDENKDFYNTVFYRFLYNMFDIDNNNELSKIDFRNFISAFLEMCLDSQFFNISTFIEK